MHPSPPASGNEELLQHGLHHIVQHNSNASFPRQEHYDEGIHLFNYVSPPDERYAYQRPPPRYQYQHRQQDSGIDIQYDGFPQEYGSMYSDCNTPATSPTTSGMMSQEIRTRGGMTLPRQNFRPMPDNRTRATKSPKPKKAKKEKVKAEKKVARLDRPLSELTKAWTHVPVVDIEGYVNRSAEDRRREVEEGKIPGKVKRPMNSFMLYRKAYQNRTKDWCLQNNHQVVSQVCGDSWPLEPEAVRKQFEDWSRTERINHQNAHPGYKFSPSKPGTVNKAKRKAESEPPLSDESDLDDFEWRDPSFRQSKKTIYQQSVAPKIESQVAYPSQRSAYLYSTSRENSMEPGHGGAVRSSYQANNPRRPLPAQYSQSNLGEGEYYQTSIQSNSSFPGGTQDVVMRKAATPSMHPGSYLGLPGTAVQDYETMHAYQYEQRQGEQRIDPSLMPHAYENGSFNGDTVHGNVYFEGQSGGRPWQQYSPNEHDPAMPYIDPELHGEKPQIHHPHAHVLKGHQEGWNAESMDGGGEFDKWMPEDERGTSPP